MVQMEVYLFDTILSTDAVILKWTVEAPSYI